MSRGGRVGPVALVLWFVGAMTPTGPALASSLAEVKARGKLVAVSFPQETSQFSRPDGQGGFEGFDIDLVQTFASRLGVDLEILPVGGYGELIPELESGRADVLASSFTITEAREEQIDFSDSYFPILVQVVVPEGSEIASIEDLEGRVGSALPGSSQERQMKQIGGIRFHHVKSSTEHWEALRTGRADFAFVDSTTIIRDRDRSAGTKIAFNLPEVSSYGFGFATGSDLRDAFNEHLSRLRGSNYLYHLIERHFGDEGVALHKLAASKK